MSERVQNFPERIIKGIWIRALAKDRTPAIDAELKTMGIDLSQPLLHSYPRAVWFPALQKTAAMLYPDVEPAVALKKLGARLIDGLDESGTFKGPAFSMVKFLGPRRMLKDIGPRIAGLGMGIEQEVREINSKELDISLNEDEGAAFVGGALERMVALLGGRAPKVDVSPANAGVSRLRVRWS